MTLRMLLSVALIGLFASACGNSGNRNPEDMENKMMEAQRQDVAKLNRQAAIIQTQVEHLPAKEYHLGTASRPIHVKGHYMNGVLVHVDENVSMGREGNARNRYYYSEGSLFLFNQQKSLYIEGAPGERMIERSTVTTTWDKGENLLSARRSINGVSDPVPEEESTGMLQRGRELFRLVADGTPPTPAQAVDRDMAAETDGTETDDGGSDARATAPPAASSTIPSGVFTERVRFRKGSTSTTINGRVTGFEVRDYMLRALKGQTIRVSLQSANAISAVHFMGKNMSGETKNWSGTLPRYGDYHVRVYLPGDQGRRGESGEFSVTIGVE